MWSCSATITSTRAFTAAALWPYRRRTDARRRTQMLRQGDAKFFKRYSQVKAQMKRALEKINLQAQRGEGF